MPPRKKVETPALEEAIIAEESAPLKVEPVIVGPDSPKFGDLLYYWNAIGQPPTNFAMPALNDVILYVTPVGLSRQTPNHFLVYTEPPG